MSISHIVPAKKEFLESGITQHNLTVIIPCAGIGRRNKSFGPKCLFKLNKHETILDRQIKIIRDVYPLADITFVLGFEYVNIYDYIQSKNYNVRVVYNNEFEYTNVAYSIGLGMQANYNKNILIIYGDLVFNQDTIRSITTDSSKIAIDSKNNFQKSNVGVITCDGCVTNISHGLDVKWSQILFLNKDTCRIFQNLALHKNSLKKFPYELLNDMIDKGFIFEAFENKNSKILEINNMADLEKGNNI